jgi:hypothetical protein
VSGVSLTFVNRSHSLPAHLKCLLLPLQQQLPMMMMMNYYVHVVKL